MITVSTQTREVINTEPVLNKLCRVSTAKHWRLFFKLPYSIYKNDPYWVPPLVIEQKKLFRPDNPFFQHAKFSAWLFFDGDNCVGRIVAFVNNAYNLFHETGTGFFGFFECIPNWEASNRLLEAAENWIQNEGMNRIVGPVNFDTGNESGVLAKGNRFQPYLQMGHTPLYYRKLLENAGYEKEHDLLAFRLDLESLTREKELMIRLGNISKRAGEKAGFTIRGFSRGNFDKEIEQVHYAYNNWMKQNWGFSPVSEKEMRFAVASLKTIVDPGLALFAYKGNTLVGCSISLPDINQVLHKMNGYLLPFGFLKYFFYKPAINRARLMLLAVSPEERNKGLDVLFCYQSILKAIELGYKEAELSWVSEENTGLITIIEKFKAEKYKIYRVYGKNL